MGALGAALLLLLSFGIVAQALRAQAPAKTDESKFLLRPIVIFNQHLYTGYFSGPRGLYFDRARSELWVADTQNNRLGVFTPGGVPIFAFGGNERVQEPTRVAVDSKGRLLVLEGSRTNVEVFSYRGEYIGHLDLPGVEEKPVFGAITFDGDGNLYVGENTSGQVLIYDRNIKLKSRIGSRGSDQGQFQSIAGIAIDNNFIYVIDHQVLAVQIFDKRGNFVRGWGKHDLGIQGFSLPEGIALDSKGRIIVVDALRHEIKVFENDGKFISRFGGLGERAGQVSYPSDVVIDAQDHIYVAERGNSRVQVFEELENGLPPDAR